MRNVTRLLALAAFVLLLPACDLGLPAGRTPHREGNRLDMGDQPKLKPQRKDLFLGRPTGLMEPQPGTVAVADTPYPYAQNEADRAGSELVTPLQPTPEVLAHGKFVYENVCITCHGAKGAGDGDVTGYSAGGSAGGSAAYIPIGRALGWPDGAARWVDVHGAGCQRSDPKTGPPFRYDAIHRVTRGGTTYTGYAFGPQGDTVRGLNFVRLVRNAR